MKRYYIPHKLKPGDITHLSDPDSAIAVSQKSLQEEEIIEIETTQQIFKAQVSFIDTASIEVQILEQIEEKEKKGKTNITIIQSITSDKKMAYILEKLTEVGVDRITPVETEYSKRSLKSARRRLNAWRVIVDEAVEQSRNPVPPIVEKPIHISELENLQGKKICLASEQIEKEYILDEITTKETDYTIAIGPETGWSTTDLNTLSEKGFAFLSLNGNILRTETAGLVAATIIKTIHKEI